MRKTSWCKPSYVIRISHIDYWIQAGIGNQWEDLNSVENAVMIKE